MRSRLVNAHVTGRQLLDLGLAEEALRQFRRHEELARRFRSGDPDNRDLLRDHAISHSLLHAALKRLGRRDEALAVLEEEVRLRAAHTSSDPKDERAARELEKARASLERYRAQ